MAVLSEVKTRMSSIIELLMDSLSCMNQEIFLWLMKIKIISYIIFFCPVKENFQVELYPFESFLAEFGGALGLFTGFSFMFFADLADWVVKFLMKGFRDGNNILK